MISKLNYKLVGDFSKKDTDVIFIDRDDFKEIVRLNPKDGKSLDGIDKAIERVTETCSMSLRSATMDAIISDIIDNEVVDESKEDNIAVTEDKAHEVIDPIVEQAIARYHLPASYRKRVNKLIAARFRKPDNLSIMLDRIARFTTDEFADIVIDNGNKKETQNEDITTKTTNSENEGYDLDKDLSESKQGESIDCEEIIKNTQESIDMDDILTDEPVKQSLKLTAVANTLSKQAIDVAKDTYALDSFIFMTNKLRHVLPESFKRRYDLI